MKLSKSTLFYLCLLTLFGMSLLGYVIMDFTPDSLTPNSFKETMVLENNIDYLLHTLIGLGAGIVAVALAIFLIRLPRFGDVKHFFADLIHNLDISWYHILFYSFCAGVGEEILFRGAIMQFPFLGIWGAAIIFVLLHGYIHPKNINLSIYGVFLIFIAALFGLLLRHYSIYAAMAAHFIYDVAMFFYMRRVGRGRARMAAL